MKFLKIFFFAFIVLLAFGSIEMHPRPQAQPEVNIKIAYFKFSFVCKQFIVYQSLIGTWMISDCGVRWIVRSFFSNKVEKLE